MPAGGNGHQVLSTERVSRTRIHHWWACNRRMTNDSCGCDGSPPPLSSPFHPPSSAPPIKFFGTKNISYPAGYVCALALKCFNQKKRERSRASSPGHVLNRLDQVYPPFFFALRRRVLLSAAQSLDKDRPNDLHKATSCPRRSGIILPRCASGSLDSEFSFFLSFFTLYSDNPHQHLLTSRHTLCPPPSNDPTAGELVHNGYSPADVSPFPSFTKLLALAWGEREQSVLAYQPPTRE